ncbi:MAG: sugar phosphorylase, partial [Acidobacteria bacterium]|nr:sugar phosphorylase [Acidobacteriota bacterium]
MNKKPGADLPASVSADAFRGLVYRLEPDYTRPLIEIPREAEESIRSKLAVLYGKGAVDEVYAGVERLIKVHYAYHTPELIELERRFDPTTRFSEKDIILITYGDMVVSKDRRPLQTLADLMETFFRGIVNTIHILPFFPYSSDRGFSVISYEEVDPRLGSWEEIEELEASFKLMFDAVFNHVSSKSYWFQQFRNGDPEYESFFTVFSTREAIDSDRLKLILRPRTTDILTPVDTIHGLKYVWTTFSPDQIDLNFKNPKVLLKVLEILLYYVRRGADLLRLDAVTFLWCELGTSCAHLAQTHAIVKLFRAVLDVVSPHVGLVTESNVPHKDNISYFGNGHDEAQLIYNFALPPLVLHSFLTGNAEILTRWAKELSPPSKTTGFLNFLDSHDGIGLLGARGILSDRQIDHMCDRIEERGGFVSRRLDNDGGESPYELNITWFSALNPEDAGEEAELQVCRFIASRAVALVLQGVAGVYLPSVIGAQNDEHAVL